MKYLIYIHGMGGTPQEGEHYRPLFPDREIIAPEYTSIDPIDGGREIGNAVAAALPKGCKAILVANSIGAFLAVRAGIDALISKAYFISPIVDMEKLIADGLRSAGATEEDLREKRIIYTPDGRELSWDYLCRLRGCPVDWKVHTEILYGGRDAMTSPQTVRAFTQKHGARLTVMEKGEHWFHTEEQMAFLDEWIKRGEERSE